MKHFIRLHVTFTIVLELSLAANRSSGAIDTDAPVEVPKNQSLDVWLLAGQSNMLGMMARRSAPIEPDERALYYSVDGKWRVASEPLDRYCFPHGDAHGMKLRENVTDDPGAAGMGAGPTVFFAKHLLKEIDGAIGIIGVSTGGTIKKKWEPNLSHQGKSFYEQVLAHVRGAGRPLKGVVWYQGESDVLWSPADAEYYHQGLSNLITALRRDLSQPDLPVIVVQIARHSPQYFAGQDGTSYAGDAVQNELETYTRAWNTVQDAQRRVADELDHVYLVATADLYPMADAIHLDMAAMQVLGSRLGEVALTNVYKKANHGQAIRLREIEVRNGEVVVRFDGVTERLTSVGRPTGFEIHCPELPPEKTKGQLRTVILDTKLSESSPGEIVLKYAGGLHLDWEPVLYYGAGMDPYCNIVDEANMAIPCFGPIPITDRR